MAIAWCPCLRPITPTTKSLVFSLRSPIQLLCSPCLLPLLTKTPSHCSSQSVALWSRQSHLSLCLRSTPPSLPGRPVELRWFDCHLARTLQPPVPWPRSWLRTPFIRPWRRSGTLNVWRNSSKLTRTPLAAVATPPLKRNGRPSPPRRSALPSQRKRRSPTLLLRVSISLVSPAVFLCLFLPVSPTVDVSKLAKTPKSLAIWPPLPGAAAAAPQIPNEVCIVFTSASSLPC